MTLISHFDTLSYFSSRSKGKHRKTAGWLTLGYSARLLSGRSQVQPPASPLTMQGQFKPAHHENMLAVVKNLSHFSLSGYNGT